MSAYGYMVQIHAYHFVYALFNGTTYSCYVKRNEGLKLYLEHMNVRVGYTDCHNL